MAIYADTNNANKKVKFKNCAPFTDCKSELNNVEMYNAKDNDTVMPMYNLIEYSENYSETFGSFYRDIPAANNNGEVIDFAENNLTD